MSKKDFIAIANTLRLQKENLESPSMFLTADTREAALNALAETTSRLADVFISANPRFDKARFYAACGF